MVTLLLIICLRFVAIFSSCPDFTEELKAECAQREVAPPDIDGSCPNLPTIFLLGPTRNGKSHFANALLAHSLNITETNYFSTSESLISYTSSIQCKCGKLYRVCDSPGIPDHCYRADIYLDQIIKFLKEEKPILNIFVLAHKMVTEQMTKRYYDALKKCVVEFSNLTTYILLNQVTSRPTKFDKEKHHYDKEIKEQATMLGIDRKNHIYHPAETWSLTESQIVFINGKIIKPQKIDTSSYKTWTNLVEIVKQDIDGCVKYLIQEKDAKIRNALDGKIFYENIKKRKSEIKEGIISFKTETIKNITILRFVAEFPFLLPVIGMVLNEQTIAAGGSSLLLLNPYSLNALTALGAADLISDQIIESWIDDYEKRSNMLKKEKDEMQNNSTLQVILCKETLIELQEIGDNLCIRHEKIKKDVQNHDEL